MKTANSAEVRQLQIANECDFTTYSLPQLPDSEADDIYERLLAAERAVASPDLTTTGYDDGVATEADELWVANADAPLLLTAEHATTHYRFTKSTGLRRRLGADYGTGALGQIVQEDTAAGFVVPVGRQTADANNDVEHAFKDAMRTIMERPTNKGHVALHGINLGRVTSLEDTRGYNIILGTGDAPTPETLAFVEKALAIARDYDLRIGVNQPIMQFEADGATPKRREDGSQKTITFAAKGPGTTRTYAHKTAQELAKPYSTVQFEIGQSLRVMPIDHPKHPGTKSQRMGTYLGYLFVRDCVRAFETA